MHTVLAIAALLVGLPAYAGEVASDAGDAAERGIARGVSAEGELRRRLPAMVRTLPGTDAQYMTGSSWQIDGVLSCRRRDGDEQDTFFVSATPFEPADRAERLSVKHSQFNWLSHTPLWTRLEANPFPLDGRTVPELSQLWLRIEDYAIVGKTCSAFMDDAALSTTLDYNGPGGVTFAQQWVARATVPLGSAGVLESSVEDAQSDFIAEGEFFAASGNARRPDAAARLRYAGEGATSSKPESRAGSPCALPGREVNRPGRLRHGRFRFRIARGVRAWRAPRPGRNRQRHRAIVQRSAECRRRLACGRRHGLACSRAGRDHLLPA